MQWVEQGKLDLNRDVNDYLDFKIPPAFGKPITLRNIMTHTAGFEEVVKDLFVADAEHMGSLSITSRITCQSVSSLPVRFPPIRTTRPHSRAISCSAFPASLSNNMLPKIFTLRWR